MYWHYYNRVVSYQFSQKREAGKANEVHQASTFQFDFHTPDHSGHKGCHNLNMLRIRVLLNILDAHTNILHFQNAVRRDAWKRIANAPVCYGL